MATTLNAGTTTGTSLQITTDTTGAMNIQTSGANAISISNAQVVTLANPLPAGSGGTGVNSLGTGVATALGQNVTGSGSIVLAASPTLTGTPVAPTATAGTNTTQVATTAFVQASTTALNLGTMATENANNIAITGGTINGVTGTNSGLSVGTATNATNVTGTVGIANGGTGLTSVGTSGYHLVSTGSALQYKKVGLGITGETWHDVTGSRAFSTTYPNSNGYPIMVCVTASQSGAAGNHYLNAYINGTLYTYTVAYAAGNASPQITIIVPTGATYYFDTAGSSNTTNLSIWSELY
jgi:hypothetical protein